MLHDQRQRVAMLGLVEGRRLAGRPHCDDRVGTLLDMPIDEPAERRFIDAAVRMHGGNDGDQTALDHPQTPNRTKLVILSRGVLRCQGNPGSVVGVNAPINTVSLSPTARASRNETGSRLFLKQL